jgi:hypothetical protein
LGVQNPQMTVGKAVWSAGVANLGLRALSKPVLTC